MAATADLTNAERQRRFRARQREPARIIVRVEAEHGRLLDALIASDRLTEAEAWRKDLVELALSQVVDEWIKGTLR